MADLWFDRPSDRLARRGAMLYASRPEGVWAVLTAERTFPDDLAQESDELLALYGAAAHGIGHLLLGDDVTLPQSLTEWATAPTKPGAELGSWHPTLVSIDGSAHLALAREFARLRLYATTWKDRHVTVLTPASEPTPALVHHDGLDAPLSGWDQGGGTHPA